MGPLERSLESLLDYSSSERDIHTFPKAHKSLVRRTFTTSWNYSETFSEVSLGSDYRIDFLMICADSGAWTAHIIELKSPAASLYNSHGDKTPQLRLVEKQLAERNQWMDENEAYFRKCISDLISIDDRGSNALRGEKKELVPSGTAPISQSNRSDVHSPSV